MTETQQAIEKFRQLVKEGELFRFKITDVRVSDLALLLAAFDQLTEANRELVDTGLAAASKLNWYASSEGEIADHLAALARHKQKEGK